MPWEQRVMRMLIRGVIWASVIIATAHFLQIEMSWRVILLLIISGITSDVIETIRPLRTSVPDAQRS